MEKQAISDTIARNVRELMNQQNLSSTALAQSSKISVSTVSKIINSNMSVTVSTLDALARGLKVDVSDLLKGLPSYRTQRSVTEANSVEECLYAGVLSINNSRLAYVCDDAGNVIGESELAQGLDLTETLPSILSLIKNAIETAVKRSSLQKHVDYRHLHLGVVVQSYEFENTRKKFIHEAQRYFKSVTVLPDWKITHLATFKNKPGMSLVVDKGVSLSYLHEGRIKKLGGWKFPVYDLGGENWLGMMAIHHTIDAFEGFIPMSELAKQVLAKFDGKIEKITEICFKNARDYDIYCLFAEVLLRCYFNGETAATEIVQIGSRHIARLIQKVDEILGVQVQIVINGSLARVYHRYVPQGRFIESPGNEAKVKLLAEFAKRDQVVEKPAIES